MTVPYLIGCAVLGVVGVVYGLATGEPGTALWVVIGLAVVAFTIAADPRRRR